MIGLALLNNRLEIKTREMDRYWNAFECFVCVPVIGTQQPSSWKGHRVHWLLSLIYLYIVILLQNLNECRGFNIWFEDCPMAQPLDYRCIGCSVTEMPFKYQKYIISHPMPQFWVFEKSSEKTSNCVVNISTRLHHRWRFCRNGYALRHDTILQLAVQCYCVAYFQENGSWGTLENM